MRQEASDEKCLRGYRPPLPVVGFLVTGAAELFIWTIYFLQKSYVRFALGNNLPSINDEKNSVLPMARCGFGHDGSVFIDNQNDAYNNAMKFFVSNADAILKTFCGPVASQCVGREQYAPSQTKNISGLFNATNSSSTLITSKCDNSNMIALLIIAGVSGLFFSALLCIAHCVKKNSEKQQHTASSDSLDRAFISASP